MGNEIELKVNGQPKRAMAAADSTLLDVLREGIGLRGTKEGCQSGECGSCTVLMDGAAVRACLTLAHDVRGKEITTIEGIASAAGRLSLLQRAFVNFGAVQCGYCTPGMIMSAKALLDSKARPTEDEIREAIAGNLCRCTGYAKIVEAIKSAAVGLDAPILKKMPPKGPVGQRLALLGSEEKVSGRAIFATDLSRPGMLHGKIVRSAYPHARLLKVDAEAAKRLPGVYAVITSDDAPGLMSGVSIIDRPLLASDRVRHVGEAIAAVAAVDERTAQEAIRLIDVNYEELPAVFSAAEAVKIGAPILHDLKNSYERPSFIKIEPEGTNILTRHKIKKGDVERGFELADMVFEGRYKTQFQEHASLEPHAAMAELEPSGRITIWTSTQAPSRIQRQVAQALGMAQSKIRIIQTATGGGFGGKIEATIEPICAILTMKTGKPVKIVHSRQEEFTSSTVRHPFDIAIKTGFKKDGELLALKMEILFDTGAYSYGGESVGQWAVICAPGPYSISNVSIDCRCVYTNNIVGGAMRGFGNPQVTFARETHLDMAAEGLGIDPIELRLKNALREGSQTATGHRLSSGLYLATLEDTLRKAARSYGWPLKRSSFSKMRGSGKAKGAGVASMFHGSGYAALIRADSSSCFVKLNEDGSATLITGAADVGQGSDTALAQILAQELGLPFERIIIARKDTDTAPYDGGSSASRVTYICGNAVREAAQKVRRQLLEAAAQALEANPEDLEVSSGVIRAKGSPWKSISVDKASRFATYVLGKQPMACGHFKMEGGLLDEDGQGVPFAAYLYGTQIAEVEVDRETGEVRVLNIVAAHEVGRAINPMSVEGQLEGAAAMGLGYALMEKIEVEEGRPLSLDFSDYKVPSSLDAPSVRPIIIERIEPSGPFGAKGVAEAGAVPTAAAIANAVYHAAGVRIFELPITKEKVLNTIRAKNRGR